jgi:hypothetical protein
MRSDVGYPDQVGERRHNKPDRLDEGGPFATDGEPIDDAALEAPPSIRRWVRGQVEARIIS